MVARKSSSLLWEVVMDWRQPAAILATALALSLCVLGCPRFDNKEGMLAEMLGHQAD